jgi:RTX calcium-binding nonapeptide repeat (4 copies)
MKRVLSGMAGLALVCALALSAPALAKILKGTPGDDKLIGSKNGDKLIGRGGDDILRSAEGGDLVIGNGGKDFIKAGKGFDEMRAGRGGDEIHARDGKEDQIDCGPGTDTVLADEAEDGMFNCEVIKVIAE